MNLDEIYETVESLRPPTGLDEHRKAVWVSARTLAVQALAVLSDVHRGYGGYGAGQAESDIYEIEQNPAGLLDSLRYFVEVEHQLAEI